MNSSNFLHLISTAKIPCKGHRAGKNLQELESMAANMAGLRAGLQHMRAQMRARGQALHQTLRAHSTKAAAAGGGGGLLAFAQS